MIRYINERIEVKGQTGFGLVWLDLEVHVNGIYWKDLCFSRFSSCLLISWVPFGCTCSLIVLYLSMMALSSHD